MRSLLLALPILLTACATARSPNEPSLAPRAAEAIDPRVPIPSEPVAGTLDGDLANRLGDLLSTARQGDAAFTEANSETGRLVAAAGAVESESWVSAQQSLSRLVALREPVTRAAADIDELQSTRVRSGGVDPADLAALEAAANEVAAINRRQAAAITQYQERLGG